LVYDQTPGEFIGSLERCLSVINAFPGITHRKPSGRCESPVRSDTDLSDVRILVLATFEVDEYVVQAIEAGASGFLSKSVNPAELNGAIRIIARGDALLSPKATSAVIS
jgi:hypothetical protein